MKTKETKLRKAAILIDTLDAKSADALLEQMGEEMAARVRREVMALTDVTDAERAKVVADFMGKDSPTNSKDELSKDGANGSVHRNGISRPAVTAQPLDAASQLAGKNAADSFESSVSPNHDVANRGVANGGVANREVANREVAKQWGTTHPTYEALPSHGASRRSLGTEANRHVHQPSPFAFLHQVEAKTLAQLLDGENTQAIAVVVSHLEPTHSADVLAWFSPSLQTSVLRRLYELDEAHPDVLDEIEQYIRSQLDELLRLNDRRSAGLAAVSAIVDATGNRERGHLLSNLAKRDRDLLRNIEGQNEGRRQSVGTSPRASSLQPKSQPLVRKPWEANEIEKATKNKNEARQALERESLDNEMPESPVRLEPEAADAVSLFPFDDLMQLDDRSLLNLFRQAEAKVALLALVGAKPELVLRLLKKVSRKEAKQLRNRIEKSGPVRLSDIETAQREIVRDANRLAELGQLKLPGKNKVSIAV